MTKPPRRTAPVGAGARLGLLFLFAVSSSCSLDRLLEIEDPDVATEESLLTEAALPVLHAGALRDFQVAFSGHPSPDLQEGVVLLSGLLADEFEHSGTFTSRRDIDRRVIVPSNVTSARVFAALHRARVAARRATRAFEQLRPDDPRRAETLVIEGYAILYLAELFCSGVPLSEPRPDAPWVYGEPLSTTRLLEEARSRFIEARAHPTGTSGQRHLARLGEGRALLGLGQFSAAASAVAPVPTDFAWTLEHSENTLTQQNGIWFALNGVRRYRIADRKGGNGLPWRSSGDPRISWIELGSAFDPDLVAYGQWLYPGRDSPVTPARGIEARLIQAEAALREGQLIAFVGHHNELRERVEGLSPFTVGEVAALSEAERLTLHFRERAFWLWQSGHRLGDLRRTVRHYGRSPSEVFPSGDHPRGGIFGSDVNFPIPAGEQNNPNAVGCLDRSA